MRNNLLLIDNLDSFTDNVRHLFARAGADPVVIRTDRADLADVQAHDPDLIILSPGPGHPADAQLNLAVIRHFLGRTPIFGVCLGMQCLALALGASVVRSDPCHGKQWSIEHTGQGMFTGMANPAVVGRYHSLVTIALTPELETCAWTETGDIMALRHRSLPAGGVQFHPESFLTEDGIRIAENILHDRY